MYLHDAAQHAHGVNFREIASFAPFDGANGARVATTSTTSGADLLVSGVSSGRTGKWSDTTWSDLIPTPSSSTPGSSARSSRQQARLPNVLGGD